MNWYKKAIADPGMSTMFFNILMDAYYNAVSLPEIQNQLSLYMNSQDPQNIVDSLEDAKINFLQNTGEVLFNPAQEQVINQIEALLNGQQIQNVQENNLEGPNLNDQAISGGIY